MPTPMVRRPVDSRASILSGGVLDHVGDIPKVHHFGSAQFAMWPVCQIPSDAVVSETQDGPDVVAVTVPVVQQGEIRVDHADGSASWMGHGCCTLPSAVL